VLLDSRLTPESGRVCVVIVYPLSLSCLVAFLGYTDKDLVHRSTPVCRDISPCISQYFSTLVCAVFESFADSRMYTKHRKTAIVEYEVFLCLISAKKLVRLKRICHLQMFHSFYKYFAG